MEVSVRQAALEMAVAGATAKDGTFSLYDGTGKLVSDTRRDYQDAERRAVVWCPERRQPWEPALNYTGPVTGLYLVIDTVTNESLQLGGPGFIPPQL